MKEPFLTETAEPQRDQTRDLPDPATWVDEYGDYLFHYAHSRERDRGAAEDLVQETLMAALQARQSFRGQAAPQTWLLGILKRKLVDRVRTRARQPELKSVDADIESTLFNSRGKWIRFPRKWGGPEGNLQRAEFWQALEKCLSRLPPRMGAAFTMRELEERAAEQIRDLLGVSACNLNVILHRARLALSHCLDRDWFTIRRLEG